MKRYDKSKQWLKSSPKPIKESPGSVSPGTSPWKKPLRNSLALESGQVHDLLHGAVSGVVGNFVGITRAVRQRILPDKQLLEVWTRIIIVHKYYMNDMIHVFVCRSCSKGYGAYGILWMTL